MTRNISKNSLARSLQQSFPPSLATLLQEVLKIEPDFERIGQIIKTDPALAANVLSLVNSSYYGVSQKVHDLKRAAVILGTREILKIILGISLYEASHRGGVLPEKIVTAWRTTIWAAVAAQTMAEHHCPDKADLVFVSALLRDISLLLPDTNQTGNIVVVEPDRQSSSMFPEHERMSCEMLIERGLPQEMLDAIAAHHDFDHLREHPPLTQCVILGTFWSDMELDPAADPLLQINFKYTVQEQLGIPGQDYDSLRKTILQRFMSLTDLLNLANPVFDARLLTLSVEAIQRIFFLIQDLPGSSGGLESLARIIQKHLRFQWNLRAWELGLKWPREGRWTLFRCHLGEVLHEVQVYVLPQDLVWTYPGRSFPLVWAGQTWGELRIPEKFLDQEALLHLGHYTRFLSQALEQYNLRTAILEEKARILDKLPIGVAWLSPSGNVMDVNPSLRRLLGMNVAQGKDFYTALNAIGLVRTEDSWRTFIEDPEQQSMSALLCPTAMNPDISMPCLYLSAHKVIDDKRQDILVLLEDIKDIAELQTHILKQRDFLRSLINSMQDLILTTDARGNIIFASSQLPQDIMGKNLFSITRPVGELAGSWDADLMEKLTTPQEAILFFGGGPAIPLDLLFSPLPVETSQDKEFLVVGRDLSSIRRLEEKLRHQAMIDELTGLFNHRHFMDILDRETSRARRTSRPLSLIFFDLDRFKNINDTRGHQAGDEVLRDVGSILRKTVRKGVDFPSRYGGDEFAILATETDVNQVHHLAERIQAAMHDHFRKVIDLSVGLAQFVPVETMQQFLNRADRASYAAKEAGGGRIVVAA